MSTEKLRADYDALNDLIVNCPDFDRMEALLGGFNLFQVLKFEHGEIRHSNMLAWILQPAESHGLGSAFLKKWLMRVAHEAAQPLSPILSPADIDAWDIRSVEVWREWNHVDLLLVINFQSGDSCVICIENKVGSRQHSNQLQRYRHTVEQAFPDTLTRKIYILLTRSEEAPEDDAYISASYEQVHAALADCVEGRRHAIGSEPLVLLENYLRLLEEKFMDESEIARVAGRIYQQHRRAIDLIFEHRPDNLRQASTQVHELLSKSAEELGIQMEASSKVYIRFIPKSWNQAGNTHGTAWAGTNRTVLFELALRGKSAHLYAISGYAPASWINSLWERAGSPPFSRAGATHGDYWVTFHRCGSVKVSLDDDDIVDTASVAKRIFDHCRSTLLRPETQEAIQIVADMLPALDAAYADAK